jgi:hypothetical protein
MNATVARLSNLKTKDNTKFLDWWPLFNAALVKLGQPEAGHMDARGFWETGHCPDTAASYVANS